MQATELGLGNHHLEWTRSPPCTQKGTSSFWMFPVLSWLAEKLILPLQSLPSFHHRDGAGPSLLSAHLVPGPLQTFSIFTTALRSEPIITLTTGPESRDAQSVNHGPHMTGEVVKPYPGMPAARVQI